MSGITNPENELPQYAMRLGELANRDRNEAIIFVARTASAEAALKWNDGLTEELAGLATLPKRYPLAPERFRLRVRRMLYQRPKSKAAYHIYFTIENEAPGSPDAPTVVILHIRHAAAKPLTPKKIREIERAE